MRKVVHENVEVLYHVFVSLPFACPKKPGSVDCNWSTETHSPGLVAAKTECWDFFSLPLQGIFVIALNKQPAHFGGRTLASFLGIMPFEASWRSFVNEA